MRAPLIHVILLASLLSPLASGQWIQANGPYGGVILSLAVCPNGMGGANLVAGTGGSGVYLSADEGMHWLPVESDLGYVSSIQMMGEDLVAADPNKGVYLSTDKGQNWWSINSDIGDPNVWSLGIHGTDIYAGTGSATYRSTDKGGSWFPVGSHLTAQRLNCLVSLDAVIFAGTDFGLFISIDGGTEWAPANSGLNSPTITGLLVDDKDVYAVTGTGVFRSTNHGETWESASSGLMTIGVKCLAAVPGAGSSTTLFAGTYYGGVFRSTDKGASWGEVSTGLRRKNIYSLLVSGARLFAGAEGGLYSSSDGGESWSTASFGMAALPVRSFLFTSDSTGKNILLAGCEADGGLFRSTDNGITWQESNRGLVDLYILSLAAQGKNFFAGTFSMGIYRSTDGGDLWARVTPSDFGSLVVALLVRGADLFAGTAAGVYRSTDSGMSWTHTSSGLTDGQSTCLAALGTDLYVGTDGGGVYRSSDHGGNWSKVNSGLTTLRVSSLAASGGDLYAGTFEEGVFRSTNGGAGWISVNSGLADPSVRCLIIKGSALFAGTREGVFLTTDRGACWSAVGTGLGKRAIQTLAWSGSDLFAGTYAGSVWRRPLAEMLAPEAPNLVQNPGFECGKDPWMFYTNGSGRFSDDAPGEGSRHAALLTLRDEGSNVQLYQYGIRLKDGARYRLSFKAYSNTGHDLRVFLHKHDPPHTDYGIHEWRCDLGFGWRRFTTEFIAKNIPGEVEDGRLRFWLPSHAAPGDKYCIDDVMLAEVLVDPSQQPNIVLNGGFESDQARWDFHTDGAGTFDAEAPGAGSAHAAHVTIGSAGSNVQLYQSGVSLQAGARYVLSFKACSPTGKSVTIVVHKHGAPYTNYGLNCWDVTMEDSWTTYSKEFTASNIKGMVSDGRIRFWLAPYARAGDEYYFDDVSLTKVLAPGSPKTQTMAESPKSDNRPLDYALAQNFPNPFNPTTMIEYCIAGGYETGPRDTRLVVYDVLGREVAVLVNEKKTPGTYRAPFDATALPSGVYFYRLQSGDFVRSRRLTLIK